MRGKRPGVRIATRPRFLHACEQDLRRPSDSDAHSPRDRHLRGRWSSFRALVGHGLGGPRPTPQQKTPPERGFYRERMMGLEPTTFCMASRRSSQLSYIRVAGSGYQHPCRGQAVAAATAPARRRSGWACRRRRISPCGGCRGSRHAAPWDTAWPSSRGSTVPWIPAMPPPGQSDSREYALVSKAKRPRTDVVGMNLQVPSKSPSGVSIPVCRRQPWSS